MLMTYTNGRPKKVCSQNLVFNQIVLVKMIPLKVCNPYIPHESLYEIRFISFPFYIFRSSRCVQFRRSKNILKIMSCV